MRIRVFIAASVDGFIARRDGSLDWLDDANRNVPAGEDCGYAAFMADVDALVMGRGTWEKVLTFGEWPYGDLPVWVLSSRPLEIPEPLRDRVQQDGGEPEEVVARLAEHGVKSVYLDGGVAIQRFLAAGLVDELTVTMIPVLLGDGLRLFGNLPADQRLERIAVRDYGFGYVQVTYRVLR